MKIAFFVYPSAFQNKGGGEIVLEKREEYLIKKGLDVSKFDMWKHRVEDFDILHIFGSVKECLPLMQVASKRGVKVVLESIFWSDYRRAFFEEGSLFEKTEKVLRHTMKVLIPCFPSARKKMFDTADMVIPNSENEAKQISRLFGTDTRKMFVVPNGVDMKYAHAGTEKFISKYGFKDCVLSVGRIEPRKNQLNLIRAMNGVDRELVFIGEPVSGCEHFYQQCQREASDNVHFLGGMPAGSEMLMSAYAACDVFVLPGWFETPGLAALEAGLAGAKVVATIGGSTGEYFLDKVLYVKPNDPSDIRNKICVAINSDSAEDLKTYIKSKFSWENVAERMIEGYKKLI